MIALEPPPSQEIPLPTGGNRSDVGILVVDDEPSMRRFIGQALLSGGFEKVTYCHVGTQVPFLAQSESPRLIIMDVMMPGGNGLRALRRLREAPATRHIPVILTSGFNILTLEDSSQNQPDHLLAKPFSMRQLLEAVERLVPV